MKNEELLVLQGGYGSECGFLCCVYLGSSLLYCGVGCGDSAFGAEANCNMEFGQYGYNCKCW
ncbi:MAG TPA: hypothetical protein PLN06_10675 [Bacteroidales bacterium]|nr:hypothetical protein [Bacteroidales bacterium]